MAFWWVSQNRTYKHELEGGYLWAPKIGKSKTPPHHWRSLLRVQEGDIVFSSYNQKIVSISTVLSTAYDSDNPFPREGWEKDGNKIDLNYHEISNSLEIKNLPNELFDLLIVHYGPINRNKHVNEGYLFELSDQVGGKLVNLIESNNDIDLVYEFNEDIRKMHTNKTTKKSIVESRVGQGIYRKDLLDYWDEKCAVTGISLKDILIASHMKPWKVSNNIERLDVYNGLLLSPNYDKLFDGGYISFDDSGKIIISTVLNKTAKDLLKISDEDALSKKLDDKHKKYLEYHREVIFLT